MPRIEFIRDHIVKQGDGKGPVYKAGENYNVEQSYADKYKRRGLAVDFDPEKARKRIEDERAAAEAARLEARGKVVIPDQIPESFDELRALAVQLTDDTVRSRADAIRAVEAEIDRRAARAG